MSAASVTAATATTTKTTTTTTTRRHLSSGQSSSIIRRRQRLIGIVVAILLLHVSLLATVGDAFHQNTLPQQPSNEKRNTAALFFTKARVTSSSSSSSLHNNNNNNANNEEEDVAVLSSPASSSSLPSSRQRRDLILAGMVGVGTTTVMSQHAAVAAAAAAADSDDITAATTANPGFKPAKRPTAYRVDSTIPPTLLPVPTYGAERKILKDLGKGSGTDKAAIVVDTVNLNNMLNKAVFKSISVASKVTGLDNDKSKQGFGYASFVCFGMPETPQEEDVDLVSSLTETILKAKKGNVASALGLAWCPYSAQPALDAYAKSSSQGSQEADDLIASLSQSGVPADTIEMYLPLLRLAVRNSLDLIAMAVEVQDRDTVRSQGLQNVNTDRRAQYVIDAQGFIAQTQDPKYKLYTDRSLLKDYQPKSEKDSGANYFSERILVHEAGATALARYAAERPESLIITVAPIQDLRYLGGINGRIPRICKFINADKNKVTENAVSTILINPTATETLSKTRRLRLEIGTGPDTLDFQTKVADYLWFSSSPKVSLIPRLMNNP